MLMLLTTKTICVTFSNGNLDVLLPYLQMGGYMCAASLILGFERSHLCRLLRILTCTAAALQNVSHHSCLTVEQRAAYADWFRKIGTDAQLTLLPLKTLLRG